MRSSSEQRHRFCTVCSNEKACITVDIDTSKKYLCLLHFSIFDKDIPTSTKKSQLKSSILDQVEYSRQSIEVKDLWKEATADVILKMFEYEVEEQRQARLSEVPAILPRTIRNDDRSIVSVPNVGESSVHREASSDADILPAPSYAWRRGLLSEDTELKKNTAVPNSKKRVGTTSLWRTGLQKQSKKEVLEEAERILEIDRINAQGIPCTNCGSRLTFSHNLTNYDISKNETWGSKDVNNMTARVECRECRNIWTILSES